MWLPAVLLEMPTWWKHVDRVNDAMLNANFDHTIRHPGFWAFSAVVIIGALFRGAKSVLILYVGAIAMWGIFHHTVLADRASAAESSSSVLVFSALVVAFAGIAIYFTLIRD